MEIVFINDRDISSTIESMVNDLHEMAAFSRTAASILMPDGQEMSAITTGEPGSVSHCKDARIEEDSDGGSGSVELF